MKNNFQKFLDLVRENPDLEVIPVVGSDVVADEYDWEEQRQYEALPWKKTILVYITGRIGGNE